MKEKTTTHDCLNCTKQIPQTPGKRRKDFCNSTCRSNYWQKQKRKEKKIVPTIAINDLTQPNLNVKHVTLPPPKTNFVVDTTKKKDIPPMPVKNEGEHPIDFAERKNDWKRKYGQ